MAQPDSDDVVVVAPEGEIDLSMAPKLRQDLTDAVEQSRADVLVDLTDVTFIDSTGISTLLNALRRLTRGRRRMLVVAPPGGVRRVFELAGMRQTFSVYDSRDDAMASLG